MGPTSSGKTTLARLFHQRLLSTSDFNLHFDGDEVRDTFGNNFGFTNNDRMMVVKTLVYVSNKGYTAGANVVVSALTAFNDARLYIKGNLKNSIVIYLRCSLSECIKRDPKGLYAKEKLGEINTLVGVNTTYNEPECPDIILNTEGSTPKDSLQELISELGKIQIII